VYNYLSMEKIQKIILTDTFKKSSITFSGSIINGALGALFFVFAARFLGPSNFGLMSVAIAFMTLVTDISDLGVDTGIVRFVGKNTDTKNLKAHKYLKLGLVMKVTVGLVVFLTFFATSGLISKYIFNKPELGLPLRLISFGILGSLLFSFSIHTFQAYQKFWHWSSLYVGTNFLRLFIILVLIALGVVNIENTLASYVLMPFVGFAFSFIFLPKGFLKAKNYKSVSKDFFHYNKWVALMTAVAATSSRLDTFIAARLLTFDQVGIYSAANQLVQIVPQIAGSLGTVIAPKMAAKSDLTDLLDYLKKSQMLVTTIAVLGLLAIPIATFFIPIFYGANYLSSVPVFIVLLIAMLVFLFSIPIHNSIFYYFSYPKLFFYLSIGHLVIITFFGWFLIGRFGALGAAFSVLIGSVYNFLIPAFWVFRKMKNEQK